MKMLATDLQPSSIVDDKGFRASLKVIDPKYAPPNCHCIMRDHLLKIYESVSSELRKELDEINFCSITTDCWTSWATEVYITVTCHYIREDWKLKSKMLNTSQFKPLYTADNLSKALKGIPEFWECAQKVHMK